MKQEEIKRQMFDKAFYLVEMVKSSGYQYTDDDIITFEIKLAPYQQRYEEVKELSIAALRKGKVKDYNAYISELNYIYGEMKDLKNNLMYCLEARQLNAKGEEKPKK